MKTVERSNSFKTVDLVCPESREHLSLADLEDVEQRTGATFVARPATPFGRTRTVLVRADDACAYPVLDEGIPVLLVPEMLVPHGREREFDLSSPQYAEAYEEMAHYDAVAESDRRVAEASGLPELERSSHALRSIASIASLPPDARRSFPSPVDVWIDAPYDGLAQQEAYRHLAPIAGKVVMQLGGTGLHAVKFLLGGAAEATVVSPMPGELLFAWHLAERYGVLQRLRLVVAVGEELPFADASFDAIFSGGSVHHTETALALPECARVLRSGGRFAAIDPWRAPLYAFGTRVLGKREVDVHCRPLTPARVAPIFDAFEPAHVVQHGTFTRYPMIALGKFGVIPSLRLLRRVAQFDDTLASALRLRRFGSSVALLGEVTERTA
jgi:SAM-dependent methyltransferase/uncharacterized protein YbaR (Trm112 family)